MKPGEMVVSGDFARRIAERFGLGFGDEGIAKALGLKTFGPRMRALLALQVALEKGAQ